MAIIFFFPYKLGKSAIKSRDGAAVSSVKFTVMHLVTMFCIGTLLKDASDCLQNEQGMYGVHLEHGIVTDMSATVTSHVIHAKITATMLPL